jgi:hypothetical protein
VSAVVPSLVATLLTGLDLETLENRLSSTIDRLAMVATFVNLVRFAATATIGMAACCACSRVRDVRVTDVPSLAAQSRSGERVVVRSVAGKVVEIESFSRVELFREWCPQTNYCLPRKLLVLDGPFDAALNADQLVVQSQANDARNRMGPTERVFPVKNGSNVWARVSKRSFSRGAIIGGVAAGAALVFATAAVLIVRASKTSDPHGLETIIAAGAAGLPAGGASLLLTLPATRDLGTER